MGDSDGVLLDRSTAKYGLVWFGMVWVWQRVTSGEMYVEPSQNRCLFLGTLGIKTRGKLKCKIK